MAKRKYVVIIGAMKSGTTTLFDVLARHPAIAPASNKEPGFFAFDTLYDKGYAWFDQLFDFDRDRHVYRLEASTDYTKYPFVTGVWERMSADPEVDVRLIYIMRDPLRRIESHARHVQMDRKEIGQRLSDRSDHSLDAGVSPVALAVSMYAMQLDAYRPAWEAGKLLCLTLEDFKSDPQSVLAHIFAFLDLEPTTETADAPPVRNPGVGRHRLHPVWGRLVRVPFLMAVGRGLMPTSVRQRIKGLFHQEMRPTGRFNLTDQEEIVLSGLLASDRARLHQNYGVSAEDAGWR